jgi:hypothetical protein
MPQTTEINNNKKIHLACSAFVVIFIISNFIQQQFRADVFQIPKRPQSPARYFLHYIAFFIYLFC